ncbi:hypothetical protein UlMin_010257 [Ulmus minor]
MYVIEFQKRRLPHAHFLIILKSNARIYSPESIGRIVLVKIPNKQENPHLHDMVLKHMIHGPCGHLNPTNVCMTKVGTCKNKYPKPFCYVTAREENSYAIYRRHANGEKINIGKAILDSSWVVPYNLFLLANFDCHMIVEVCSTIKAIKYMYKYIYMGHDQVAFNVNASLDKGTINEIDNFQSTIWIYAPEVMWMIYRFVLNEMHPTIYSLHLHLENKQLVNFRTCDNLLNIANLDLYSRSMLTEFFKMNSMNEMARTLLYSDFHEYFVWNGQDKLWTSLKKGVVIGRIITTYPT